MQQHYRALLRQGILRADPAQQQALHALQHCLDALNQGQTPAGIYLWGPVGRGKTWLMDLFHKHLKVPAKRQHFHHFMRWLHRRLHQLRGTENPLHMVADELASSIRVLCFDEFFISDIGDAMLLGPLLVHLFEKGVVLVTTSNLAPEQLYQDGFNRQRFLPAIAAIRQQMQVVHLDSGLDHRLHPGTTYQRYWVTDDSTPNPLAALFQELTNGTPVSSEPLLLGNRQLTVIGRSPQVLWCRFQTLCEQPLASQDYIELCDHFQHLLLENVPALSGSVQPSRIARGTEDAAQQVLAGDRQLPALAPLDDAVRRFIALVDECYERRVPLYLSAAVPLTQLYTEGHLLQPFQRTYSRLQAMQKADYAPT